MKRCPRCHGSGVARSSAPHNDLTCRCSACMGVGEVNDATYRALPEVQQVKRPARKGAAQADQAGLGFGPAGEDAA
jgi:DnaJ-class molecular chaperone